MSTEQKNLEIARLYLESVGKGNPENNLAFFAEDVVQEEFPNRLMPEGATRDLNALREAAQRGSKVMTAQHYEILNMIASGDQVAVEVIWWFNSQRPERSDGRKRSRIGINLSGITPRPREPSSRDLVKKGSPQAR